MASLAAWPRSLSIAVLLSGSSAVASAKPSLLVLETEAPNLPEKTARALDDAVRDEVKLVLGSSAALLPRPRLNPAAMRLAAGCADDGPSCLVAIGGTLGAAKVLQATFIGGQERASVTLVLVDVDSNKEKISKAELLEIDELSALEVRVQVAALFGVKRALPNGRLVLHTATEIGRLEGADLMLDDRAVTRTALEAVSPGRHRVEVRQTGFETFVWIGLVRPGRPTTVPVEFKPTRVPGGAGVAILETPPIENAPVRGSLDHREEAARQAAPTVAIPPPGDRSQRIATWLLGGGAVVAAVIGVLHGVQIADRELELRSAAREAGEQCQGGASCGETVCDVPDPPAACSQGTRDQMIANASFVTAGALFAGAIIAFFVEGAADGDADGGVSAAVAPQRDGAGAVLRIRY